jgi:uncharacterized protein YbaR (Trm112 family)
MSMTAPDKKLLMSLVCPQTGGALHWVEARSELWCMPSGLAYPVREGIPIMLVDAARCLSASELASFREDKTR